MGFNKMISDYDGYVLKKFVSWLCDKYEIFEPEQDGYTIYADMKQHDPDEILNEYLNERQEGIL